jgi:hypothetical protein
MEEFIGCDAHKKFSVFVAVNEKGQAGEALRVVPQREPCATLRGARSQAQSTANHTAYFSRNENFPLGADAGS